MTLLRENRLEVERYLEACDDDISDASLKVMRTHLHLLLTYADEMPFAMLSQKQEKFVVYLRNPQNRRDGKDAPLSDEYVRKCVFTVRNFLTYLRDQRGYKGMTNTWLKQFTMRTINRGERPRDMFSPEDIHAMACAPTATLNQERIRAACIFLFLSGMRITAFLTMPLKAVDLEQLIIHQWPALGVHTKLNKSGDTRLLDIPKYPEFLQIVREWDLKVRSQFPLHAMWFAPISQVRPDRLCDAEGSGQRASGFRKDLAAFLKTVGMPYKSPHAFRHGHIRFLRNCASDVRDLEAIAHNALQTVGTMLNYGKLDSTQALETVASLCNGKWSSSPVHEGSIPDQQTIQVVLNYLLQASGRE